MGVMLHWAVGRGLHPIMCHPKSRNHPPEIRPLCGRPALRLGFDCVRPCHPERSVAKSNCAAVRGINRAGSRADLLKMTREVVPCVLCHPERSPCRHPRASIFRQDPSLRSRMTGEKCAAKDLGRGEVEVLRNGAKRNEAKPPQAGSPMGL